MSVELAVAYVNLVPSAKGMRNQIEAELDVDRVAKSEGEKAGKKFVGAFNTEAEKLKDVGKKMAAVGVVIGGGLFAAANAAGNLEAAISANVQVMGDASDAVQKWSKNSIDNVGLSERAALEAATSFGQLGKIIGLGGTELSGFSTNLVTAAADMAAFKDVPIAQALEDLQSGFAGSSEVLRKYGIFLDEGSLKSAYFRETGEQVTGTLTAQQRIVATNSELWRQGADMWGQAEREAGGLARAQDNLKAEMEDMGASIGKTLVPALTMMIGGLGDALGLVSGLNEATGGLVAMFATASAGTLAVGGATLYAIGKFAQMRESIAAMSKTAKIGAGALAALPLAITAATFVYQSWTREKKLAVQATDDLTTALVAEAKGHKDAVNEMLAGVLGTVEMQKVFDQLGVSATDVAGFIRGDTVPAIEEMSSLMRTPEEFAYFSELAEATGMSRGEILELKDSLFRLRDSFPDAQRAAETQLAVTEELTGGTDKLASSLDGESDALDGVARATGAVYQQHSKMRSEFDRVTSAASSMKAAFDRVFGAYMGVEAASDAVRDGTERLSTALKDNGATLDETTDAGRRNREQIRSQIESILGYAEASVRAGDTTKEATDKVNYLTAGLKDQLVQAGLTTEEVDAYIATLGLTPANVNTAIRLTNQEIAREDAQAWLDSLENVPDEIKTQIQADIDMGAYDLAERALADLTRVRTAQINAKVAGFTSGLTPTRSAGGRFVHGGSSLLTTVGELPGRRGDEVVLPLGDPRRLRSLLGDSRVEPAVFEALDLGGGGGGGGVSFHGGVVVNERADIEAVAQAVLAGMGAQ